LIQLPLFMGMFLVERCRNCLRIGQRWNALVLTIGTRSCHNGTFLLLIEMGGDQMMAQNAGQLMVNVLISRYRWHAPFSLNRPCFATGPPIT
jgi:hypothetical protein